MREIVSRADRLEGVISLPGDKSITHRALLLNSLFFIDFSNLTFIDLYSFLLNLEK